jgi:hypothetical protein
VGEASSSFLKKRTKKFLLLKVHDMRGAGPAEGQSFLFLFFKKEPLPSWLPPSLSTR